MVPSPRKNMEPMICVNHAKNSALLTLEKEKVRSGQQETSAKCCELEISTSDVSIAVVDQRTGIRVVDYPIVSLKGRRA